MSDNKSKLNLAAAVGAALAGSMIMAGPAQAFENPFSLQQLDGGYMQVAMNEGKCGGDKAMSTEGKCGADKAMSTEGKCGADKAMSTEGKMKEGKCGEAKCGGNK